MEQEQTAGGRVTSTRILFVDDEPTIRLTLAMILKKEGFEVTTAETVRAALQAIQTSDFDILLSDLNIEDPGDGFIVVSAMRRIQPSARTFILTGYPDFESALSAIRNQVDDYFTKPADIKKLIQTFKQVKTVTRNPARTRKRVPNVIRQNGEVAIERWLARCAANSELSGVPLSRTDRIGDLPDLLLDIADRVEQRAENMSERATETAMRHGIARREQGYTIPMLLVEASILQETLSELLQEHLLDIDISMLIPDMQQVSESINRVVETSARTFLDTVPYVG